MVGGVSEQRPGGLAHRGAAENLTCIASTQLCTCQSSSPLPRRPPTVDTRTAASSAAPSVRIVNPSSSRCVPPQCLRYAIDLVSSCFSSTWQLQSLRPRHWHWHPSRTRCHHCESSSRATIRRHLRRLLYHNMQLIAYPRHAVQEWAHNTAHDAAWEHWLLEQRLGPVEPPVVLICQQTRCRRARAFDRQAAWRLHAPSSAR